MTHAARTFMAGFFVLLPLVLTCLFVGWIGSVAYGYFGPQSAIGRLLVAIGLGVTGSTYVAYVLGLLAVAGCIYVVGLFVQSRLERGVRALADALLNRIPLVGSVYDISKRFVGLVDRKGGDPLSGMRPAWCLFGGEGGAAVLGLLPTAEAITVGAARYQAILVPSAPVPFGGCLIYVPTGWIVPADIGLEGLINIYVSMGVGSPKTLQDAAGRPAAIEKA
jgi:uncharacterized membrane protein